jgi:hypothetical protein
MIVPLLGLSFLSDGCSSDDQPPLLPPTPS